MTQKIILVQDRQDNYHLVDFCAMSGRKYTLCEQVYHQKTIINTFTIDDSFDGLCTKCKEIYDKEYGDPTHSRMHKGSLRESLVRKYGETLGQSSDAQLGYQDRADRVWDKLSRYKRKLRSDLRK